MNFLAHLYLSEDNPKIMAGNFLGDFVKGRNLSGRFDHEVVRGIELHRAIDSFTDSHPIVAKSKTRLREKYRHYSPVIVDVYYDHFLAKNWHNYHHEKLENFAERAYRTIESFDAILPDLAKHMLPYMINGNWLVHYASLEGIQRALTGMSRRTKFNSLMNESVIELEMYYDDFKKEFEAFFPQLKNYCHRFLSERSTVNSPRSTED